MRAALVVSLAALSSCLGYETADGPRPPRDAGGQRDAGSTPDAGSRPDAGSTPDAGATPLGCLKVMPLGDSITLGVNGGYRNDLYAQLTDAGCGVNYVGSQSDEYAECSDQDHEGHPGFTIVDIADQIDAWLASAEPDYVLLLIGTNDVAWWSADTADEIADRHAQLVDRILTQRPGVWVVVASIPPLTSATIEPNAVDRAQLGRDLNVAIKLRVDARLAAGKRVRFADVYASLTTADLYDGVHPTREAHATVADVWLRAMLPITTCLPHLACGP